MLIDLDDNSLTTEGIESFDQNGFFGPFKVYSPEDAKNIIKAIRVKNSDRSNAIFDNDVNYDRHFDITELSQHISRPEIVKKLESIIGADILCWRSEFFPKFPGSKGTDWHQVESYKYATGSAHLVPTLQHHSRPMDLTVWTTFTEATKENGCLKFMPGSHKKLYFDESITPKSGRGIYDVMNPETSSFFGYNFEDFKIDKDWEPDESKAVAMEMKAGEAIIFTAMCMHGSFPNTSKRSTRYAISTRYVPTHVKVYPDKTEFVEHGGFFDLKNYGCVLVAGADKYKHNQLRIENNSGEPFIVL